MRAHAPHTPRAVVMVGTYGPCAKFIRLCRDSGFNPLFMNVSFVGAAPLAAALGKTDARVVITQVVPHPFDVGVPLVAEFQSDLKLRDPGAAPGFTSLEGYIAARVLVRALENIRGEPTRESIVTGPRSLPENVLNALPETTPLTAFDPANEVGTSGVPQ